MKNKQRRSQKVSTNENNHLKVKSYPKTKKKKIIEKPKNNEECPNCKQRSSVELDKG